MPLVESKLTDQVYKQLKRTWEELGTDALSDFLKNEAGIELPGPLSEIEIYDLCIKILSIKSETDFISALQLQIEPQISQAEITYIADFIRDYFTLGSIDILKVKQDDRNMNFYRSIFVNILRDIYLIRYKKIETILKCSTPTVTRYISFLKNLNPQKVAQHEQMLQQYNDIKKSIIEYKK